MLTLAATFIGENQFHITFGKFFFFFSYLWKKNSRRHYGKIAARLETPYKRLGILDEENNDQVKMGRKQEQNNNNNNNNEDINTTVAF